MAVEALLLCWRWRKAARQTLTAEVLACDGAPRHPLTAFRSKLPCTFECVQEDVAIAEAVLQQGTVLLRDQLQPDEVLLWVGCTGVTSPDRQVTRDGCFRNGMTTGLALVTGFGSALAIGFAPGASCRAALAGGPMWQALPRSLGS